MRQHLSLSRARKPERTGSAANLKRHNESNMVPPNNEIPYVLTNRSSLLDAFQQTMDSQITNPGNAYGVGMTKIKSQSVTNLL